MATVPDRNLLYRLLQVAKRDLHMEDEDYRALLARHGATDKDGRISASTMQPWQLDNALKEMKEKGFKPTGSTKRQATRWRKPRIDKITALWCALADAGVVRDRSEAAMLKWCARITRKARLEWANDNDFNACIEGLKSWAARERVKLEN